MSGSNSAKKVPWNTLPSGRPKIPWFVREESLSSVKVFWLEKEKLIEKLVAEAQRLAKENPEIEKIVLFGSLPKVEPSREVMPICFQSLLKATSLFSSALQNGWLRLTLISSGCFSLYKRRNRKPSLQGSLKNRDNAF